MKQSLQLKLSQQLTLTPQLQQSIRLLQMSTLDLSSELERYLLDNPMLERADEGGAEAPSEPADSAGHDDDAPPALDAGDWGSGGSHSDDDEFDPILNAPARPSLREHLLSQLREMVLSRRELALLEILIDELDDDGYLATALADVAAALPLELEVDEDELEYLRRLLQQLDPSGIGSRDLGEFLAQQLSALPHSPARELASQLAGAHLALLGNRDYNRLRRLTGASEAELRAAQALIAELRPRPAGGFDSGDTHYLTPDVVVRKRRGVWQAQLNDAAIPRLRVNRVYADLLQRQRDNGGLSGQLQEARWLVKNIQQRFDTILKVSEAIVERQQAFFEQGETAMKPLILRDIADTLGLHESTISRVTTQKYLLCSRGLFELKYFFGTALDTDDGGECSATAIKAHIRRLIDDEDRSRPLSDSALAERLAALGIQVARRTVAKYREAMHIPTANLRKAL